MTLLYALPALAWRPFIDPISLHEQWWALLPLLALGISVIYKAVRLPDQALRERAAREVLIMTIQIVAAMIALALASYLLVEVYRPIVR
ncbi:MAG: hypothetical protein H7Y88_07690 [Phycisphaerales bacterium]|nr:hypothetical protein [Phycisphaerales bacterium]